MKQLLDCNNKTIALNSPLTQAVSLWLQQHQSRCLQGLTTEIPPELPIEAMALKIAKHLLGRAYTRQKPADIDAFLRVITQACQATQPIPIILGHGPIKAGFKPADWAEWFTLLQLAKLHNELQVFYPPGLQITFYLDDARAHRANHIPMAEMALYRQSLQALINTLGLASLITLVSFEDTIYPQYYVLEEWSKAAIQVTHWEQQPENAAAMAAQTYYAQKNQWRPEQDTAQAAHLFRVLLQAEMNAGVWSAPNTLYGRYNAHNGFWQLYSLKKGVVTQPWRGTGALEWDTDTATGQPKVITAQHQDQLEKNAPYNFQTIQTHGLPFSEITVLAL